MSAFYRNAYRAALVPEWLPALDGIVEKLERGARVADVGCGHAHSTVLMASAFERSQFVGFDTHSASVEAARANAQAAGVAERVDVQRADATSYPGEFDLICLFDAFHDLGDPVGAARHAFAALADGGTLMVVEPFAGDTVKDNLGPVGHLYYAASTALCLPHSRSEGVGLGLGAQAGPPPPGRRVPRSGLSLGPPCPRDAVQPRPRGAPLIVLPAGAGRRRAWPAR